MLGFKDYKGTVIDSLTQVMEEKAGNRVGAIRFSRKDRTSVAILYVMMGGAYGIELSTYKPNIVSRLVSSPHLTDVNRDRVLEKYGEDRLDDYSVVEFVLTGQMLPQTEVMRILREHFFDCFDEMGTWDDVHTEWKPGQEPPTNIIKITKIQIEDLLTRFHRRRDHQQSVIAPEWGVTPDKIGDLLVQAAPDVHELPEELKSDSALLLSAITSSGDPLSISQLSAWLGMSRFSTKLSVFELWTHELVTVINRDGLEVTANPNPAGAAVAEAEPQVEADPYNMDKIDAELRSSLEEKEVAAPLPPLSASTFASSPAVEEPKVEESAVEEEGETVDEDPAEVTYEEAPAVIEETVEFVEEPQTDEPSVEEQVEEPAVEDVPAEETPLEEEVWQDEDDAAHSDDEVTEEPIENHEPEQEVSPQENVVAEPTEQENPVMSENPTPTPAFGGDLAALAQQVKAEAARLTAQQEELASAQQAVAERKATLTRQVDEATSRWGQEVERRQQTLVEREEKLAFQIETLQAELDKTRANKAELASAGEGREVERLRDAVAQAEREEAEHGARLEETQKALHSLRDMFSL